MLAGTPQFEGLVIFGSKTSSKAHQNTTGENYASWKITTHAGLRYFDLFKSGSY
jgi:hypothetical protein